MSEHESARRTTLPIGEGQPSIGAVRRFRLSVLEGGKIREAWESRGDRCAIGSHPSNDLVIDDPTVSGFHCEIEVGEEGARVRDTRSLNGTIVDGVRVLEAFLRSGDRLQLGHVSVRFDLSDDLNRLPISPSTNFGELVGVSLPMRSAFALLERASLTEVTVLLEGETGTGKGRAAEGIHRRSARRDQPFIVLDCAAIPVNLIEAELFGHERGAFTGADSRRIGAFEEANGGTIFLDEIGELPLDLQPKLLRVLESKEVRRVGANTHRTVDVRVVAATNRDLRAQVNAGRFRSDLYFRLAVVKVTLPPLRQRPEDIPMIVEGLLPTLGVDLPRLTTLLTPEFMASLQRSAWPGNVRELRNYLQRCSVFEQPPPVGETVQSDGTLRIDTALDYVEARRKLLAQFERGYLESLLATHQGKVAAAAQAAGIDRVYFYRLLRRNHIKV